MSQQVAECLPRSFGSLVELVRRPTLERKLVEEYVWEDDSGRGAEVELDEPFDDVLRELAPAYPRYLPVLHQPHEFS